MPTLDAQELAFSVGETQTWRSAAGLWGMSAQNLVGAFGYNTLGIPVAMVLYRFFGVPLSPILAAAAMAFSSVTVVTNANRLRYFQPKRIAP